MTAHPTPWTAKQSKSDRPYFDVRDAIGGYVSIAIEKSVALQLVAMSDIVSMVQVSLARYDAGQGLEDNIQDVRAALARL